MSSVNSPCLPCSSVIGPGEQLGICKRVDSDDANDRDFAEIVDEEDSFFFDLVTFIFGFHGGKRGESWTIDRYGLDLGAGVSWDLGGRFKWGRTSFTNLAVGFPFFPTTIK